MMIETIVFDFGGVLIDWNPRHYYRDVFADDARMEVFLSEICDDEWNARLDRGSSFAVETERLKARQPAEWHPYIDAYAQGWVRMLGGAIEGSVEILRSLKGRYRLYGLTNWSAETFPVARAKFGFLGLFDGIAVSGEEGMIKPDPEFFRLLCSRYNVAPEKSIFIDDNARNVEAANALGFNAIRFTSPEALRQGLEGLGVTV
ncbi:MAG: HAD family phosphatase [Rikenellaceae bacterium]|nr:HAD family phosphatase [Rikenellaceae bacterium]